MRSLLVVCAVLVLGGCADEQGTTYRSICEDAAEGIMRTYQECLGAVGELNLKGADLEDAIREYQDEMCSSCSLGSPSSYDWDAHDACLDSLFYSREWQCENAYLGDEEACAEVDAALLHCE